MDRRGERANYRTNRSGLILQKKIRKFAQNRQTDTHTDREFNYRGHSYPLWISGGSGPIESESAVGSNQMEDKVYAIQMGSKASRVSVPLWTGIVENGSMSSAIHC